MTGDQGSVKDEELDEWTIAMRMRYLRGLVRNAGGDVFVTVNVEALRMALDATKAANARAEAWHRAVETICTIAGVSHAGSAEESATAIRERLTTTEQDTVRLQEEVRRLTEELARVERERRAAGPTGSTASSNEVAPTGDDGICIGCGGTDGACSCFDDDEDDLLSDWPDCHMHAGSCGKAGSEECDWECPNSRFLK